MSKKNINFDISERKLLLRFFDLMFIGFSIYVIGQLFSFDYFSITETNWTWLLLLGVYILAFGGIFELYDLQKARKIETTFSSVLLTVIFTVLLFLFTPYYAPSLPENRLQIVYFAVTLIVPLIIWRLVYINFFVSSRFVKRGLIIGDVSNIGALVNTLKEADPNYEVLGYINSEVEKEDVIKYRGVPEFNALEIFDVIANYNISEVVIATTNYDTMAPEVYTDIVRLLEKGFPIKGYTQVYEELAYKVPVQHVGVDFYKYLAFNRNNTNRFYTTFRRVLDIILSILGIMLGVALFPIVLIGNLIGNRGPLFYTQERVGEFGKVFKIVKYRSMVVNAEIDGAKWAQKNDVRITKFGRFLRGSRLDEFPQFINILKGNMSFIGPRPERPHFVKELSSIIPFYQTRHIVKPGLTGWAQVKSRYGSSIDDSLVKLQYDLYYIKHRDFFLDFNIMIKTLSTVVFFRGQ